VFTAALHNNLRHIDLIDCFFLAHNLLRHAVDWAFAHMSIGE
jgi:hypothetical protein